MPRYHSFYIHSFVDGHRGEICIPGILNSAAINMGVQRAHSHLEIVVYIHNRYTTITPVGKLGLANWSCNLKGLLFGKVAEDFDNSLYYFKNLWELLDQKNS